MGKEVTLELAGPTQTWQVVRWERVGGEKIPDREDKMLRLEYREIDTVTYSGT